MRTLIMVLGMSVVLLLITVCLAFKGALCRCYCEDFRHFEWSSPTSINVSLENSASLYMEAYIIDPYDCREREAYWEIERADNEIETYIVLNDDDYHYGRDEEFPDRGLSFDGFCDYICRLYMTISPTDMRYNGAQITGVFNLAECYYNPNTTDTTTLNIQGLLEAPTDVTVDSVGIERVTVSWSPPFTLIGVPILHYSVNITSQGYTIQRNTTDTYVILERPCTTTTYQISAWNEVGEGNATIYNYTLGLKHAVVKAVSLFGGICASCYFISDCAAGSCAIELQNDKYTFFFDLTRQTREQLALLECFSVPEAGVFSVLVYEVLQDGTMGYTSLKLPEITISAQSTAEQVRCSEKERERDTTGVTVGLSTVLSLLLVGVMVAVLIAVIFIMKQRKATRKQSTGDPNRVVEPKSGGAPPYENIEISTSTPATTTEESNKYEHVELPGVEHESTIKYEEIELSTNTAYGTVQR